jgi:hypothetical protein
VTVVALRSGEPEHLHGEDEEQADQEKDRRVAQL